jgi:hypothetical protein
VAEYWFALSKDDQKETLIVRAIADSGMLRGEIPSFAELLERIALLEQQCNAIAPSFS